MATKKKPENKKKTQNKTTKTAKPQPKEGFVDLYSKKIMLCYFGAFLLFIVITLIDGANTWMNFKSGIFAFFGVSIYVFDILLVVIGIMLAVNKFKRKFLWSNVGAALMIISLASLASVFATVGSNVSDFTFGDLFRASTNSAFNIPSSGFSMTGGVIGGLFGNGLQIVLGKKPTALIYAVLFIISIVLSFDIPLAGLGDLIASRINKGRDTSGKIAGQIKNKHEVNKVRRNDIRTARSEERQIAAKRKEIQRHKEAQEASARRRAELERLEKEHREQLEKQRITPAPEPLVIEYPEEFENIDSGDEIPDVETPANSTETESEQADPSRVMGRKRAFSKSARPQPSVEENPNREFVRITTSKPITTAQRVDVPITSPAGTIGSGIKTPITIKPVTGFEDIPSTPFHNVETFVPEGNRDPEGQIITGTTPEVIEAPEEEDEITEVTETVTEPGEPADKEAEEIIRNAAELNKKNELENRKQVAQYKDKPKHLIPPIDCLNEPKFDSSLDSTAEMNEISDKLIQTLKSFGVETKMLGASRGPSVTRYELQPAMGVRINKITNLADDIALNLASAGIRIEAPIPGKSAVGIEVPNKKRAMVSLKEIISSDVYKQSQAKSKLSVALGKDISGAVNCADLAKMPHMLVAGTTGSGKSVTMNCMIVSLLYNASPDEVKILLIDPKQVEFAVYNGIPHLYVPVISDARKASGALTWAVTEMERRYKLFSLCGVRDLASYNKYVENHPEEELKKEPQSVIFIDELADLMMVSPKEVEDAICRLAQKARAAGMHLVVATQRPSVDVVTGLIKANVPSRLALSVSSQVDSRTIIDTAGAEKLLGNGDMLFNPLGVNKPIRIQGAFVSDEEIERIVDFLKEKAEPDYNEKISEEIERYAAEAGNKKGSSSAADEEPASSGGKLDALFDDVLKFACETGEISGSLIMRKFSLGYGRSAKIIDQMMERGYLGDINTSTKKRPVLISIDKYWEMKQYEEASGGQSVKQESANSGNPFDEPVDDSFDILSDD